mgnify:CR=1 FL=1|jgi:hypothetical protein
MKKFLLCTTAIAAVVGLVSYMDKNGVPILGNLTMNIPIKIGIDPYDLMMDGIHFLESKGIEGI